MVVRPATAKPTTHQALSLVILVSEALLTTTKMSSAIPLRRTARQPMAIEEKDNRSLNHPNTRSRFVR